MRTTCIYCGKPLGKKPQIVLVGKDRKEKLLCCSVQCYDDTKRFIEWDRRYRLISYIVIAVCVGMNLFVIGNEVDRWWKYIPTVIIGICLSVWPLVFTHYHTYERYGITRTLKYVRLAGYVIIAAGIIFTVFGQ